MISGDFSSGFHPLGDSTAEAVEDFAKDAGDQVVVVSAQVEARDFLPRKRFRDVEIM